MIRHRILAGILALLAAAVCLVDIFFFVGVYIPAVVYVIPTLLAAYFLTSPRMVAGIAAWTVALQVVAYLLHGAGMALLPASYVLGLIFMSTLSVVLSERVRRESWLRSRVQKFACELQAKNEELQIQSEEIQSQSEELQSQNEELRRHDAERERLLAEVRDRATELVAVVENTQAQLALLDRDLNFVTVNSAYERGCGYRRNELIGRNHFALFPNAENQVIFERVRDTGQPFQVLEKPFEFPSRPEMGTTYWNWVLVPIKDGGGHTRELLLSLLDVTEQVEARQRVEAAVRVRDEFLAVAAHELKTPVTSLQGFAQLTLRELDRKGIVDPERLSMAMQRIEQQSKRLTRLNEQLLNLSRLESGKLSLLPEETDLAGLARGTISDVLDSHPGQTIELQAGPVGPILLDPLRIEQVLTNLLDNAIKFSPAGSRIEVEVGNGEDGWAELAVRDHGIGIPKGEEERVFERFHQAHPERHAGGMGIGLFVSRQMVEMHGGSLAAEQPDDGGSRFVVRLPVTRQATT